MLCVEDTTIEGVCYSVQLDGTVVVLSVCSYAWANKQWDLLLPCICFLVVIGFFCNMW